MALQQEIWLNDITEGLFADNTFAARSLNHSGFVNNRTVHIPNAGAAPNVEKDRTARPATISTRTDADLYYTIHEYTTDPIHIPNAEEVELSYDKRTSVLSGMRNALADRVHTDLLTAWAAGANAETVTDTATLASGIKDLVLNIKQNFDEADIPQVGRVICLNPIAYSSLLKQLTDFEGQSFLASANAQTGIIGSLYGFDVYMRSKIATSEEEGTTQLLAWQSDCVSHAMGATELFISERDAAWYGDILSALVRAGGSRVRADKAGVFAINLKSQS